MIHRAVPARLLLSDRDRLPDPAALVARMPAGYGLVLRHVPDVRSLAALAAQIRRRRIVLLVAGDWRLAARLGARGLHLSERMGRHGLLAAALGWRRRRKALLTMACHSRTALGRAKALGADAALLSPVFPTPSHPGAATLGAVRFGLWVRKCRLPVLALGGMNRRTIRRLPPGMAAGIAGIGGIF